MTASCQPFQAASPSSASRSRSNRSMMAMAASRGTVPSMASQARTSNRFQRMNSSIVRSSMASASGAKSPSNTEIRICGKLSVVASPKSRSS
jgi:hypothetical protein